ncbi:hypothetical protein [Oerskovia enterophila]|uniref:hypothetical protein n=1 Tax=Oerskovia enterophila TaxID=43678 RepID=UPI003391C115
MSPTPQLAVDLSSHLAGGPGWAAGVTAETTPSPAPTTDELRPGLEPTDVSPGLPGFLTIFAVALACVVLFLSLTKQLRKVRYDERGAGKGAAAATSGGAAAAGTSSTATTTGTTDPDRRDGVSDTGSGRDDAGSSDSGSSSDAGSSGGDSGGGGD